MAREKSVNEARFLEIREQLSKAEHATKEVPLSSISVDEKSMRKGQILVGGTPITVNSYFFVRLASMLKLSTGLTHELLKNNDDKLAMHLINGLKDYRSSTKGGNVLLIANPNTKEIVDICEPSKYRKLSNETVFDLTSRILNDHSNMIIESVDVDHRGRASINLLNNDEVGFANAGADEFFKFGFSIVQTSRDTYVEMYNQRLVCTNGLRASLGQGAIGGNRDIQFQETFKLQGHSAEDVKIFLNHIEQMKKANFVPTSFEATLMSAVNTKASLVEVQDALITAQRMVREPDENMKKAYLDTLDRKWFPGHADAMARIVKKGIDPTKLSEKQKSFIKTNMSVWDVVNSMTFLGSNNTGIPLDSKESLKATAGSLFGKGTKSGYDLQFAEFASL